MDITSGHSWFMQVGTRPSAAPKLTRLIKSVNNPHHITKISYYSHSAENIGERSGGWQSCLCNWHCFVSGFQFVLSPWQQCSIKGNCMGRALYDKTNFVEYRPQGFDIQSIPAIMSTVHTLLWLVDFNSFEWNFRDIILKQSLMIDGWGISCEIALMWMSLDFADVQSILVQVPEPMLTQISVAIWRH